MGFVASASRHFSFILVSGLVIPEVCVSGVSVCAVAVCLFLSVLIEVLCEEKLVVSGVFVVRVCGFISKRYIISFLAVVSRYFRVVSC